MKLKPFNSKMNHLHNSQVIKEGQGPLVVTYRPHSGASWEDYVPCDMCLGYYDKWDSWKHRKRCTLLPVGRVITNCQMLLHVCTASSKGLKNVLSKFWSSVKNCKKWLTDSACRRKNLPEVRTRSRTVCSNEKHYARAW